MQSAAPASSLPAAPVAAPGAPVAPATAIASAPVDDDGDLVEVARQELGNVALLVLARARDMLARTQPGAQSLKSIVASAEIADRLLRRAGFDVASAGEAQAPRMVIVEMTASECEAARAAAETEHNESFGSIEDGDELPDEEEHDDEVGPRQRAA